MSNLFPCPVLVDGDTGKIIAAGDDARGDLLPIAVEKALKTKGKKLPGLGSYNPNASEKLVVVINGHTIAVRRTSQLKSAEKEALARNKPIAWIVSNHRYLDGIGKISETGSRSATLHALYALRDRAVLTFEDANVENHKDLPLVDKALHSPNPEYVYPVVLF